MLVDWPDTYVPMSLIRAGFIVYGSSPSRYSHAAIAPDPPPPAEGVSAFPPESDSDSGFLVFERLKTAPRDVDIVAIYRPAEELAGIMERQVLGLGANAVWLQPPITSADAAARAREHGIDFVEGIDIAEFAQSHRGTT